jgi:lysozyme family protein
MTAVSYAAATSFTILQEGGYTDDPRDSGNWSSGIVGQGTLIGSNMGCGAPATIAYMAQMRPNFVVTASWMRALPRPVYDGMARESYWRPMQCDALASGVDLSAFDDSWNTGTGSAAKKLQWLVGVTQDGQIGPLTLGQVARCSLAPIARALSSHDAALLQAKLGVTADGIVGPMTLGALAAAPDATVRPMVLLLGLAEAQSAYYRTLYNFPIYGDGWLARTGRRLAAAISLATGQPLPAQAERDLAPAPRVPDMPAHIRWRPFEPGIPIADQAARLAA